MSSIIRIGIVGTGGMAHEHARRFQPIPGVELASCFDIERKKAETYAARWGIPSVAADLKELIDRVDAVCVVTPDRFHADISLKVLEAGKHCLCEKPLTVTLADARRVSKAAEKAGKRGVVHMTNFSYRNAAGVWAAADLVQSGALGSLRHVHAFYLQTWLSSPVWGPWTNDGWLWRLETAAGSGGVLFDIGCHLLDMTTAIAGDLEKIHCHLINFPKVLKGSQVKVYKGHCLDANDTAIMELGFKNGAAGVVHTTRWATGHTNHLSFEANGTQGAVRLDLDKGYDRIDVCLGRDTTKAAWAMRMLKPVPSNYERFIRAIRTGRQSQPDMVRGAQIQAYCDTCMRSSKSGKWEKVLGW